jgi:hypothetical protein
VLILCYIIGWLLCGLVAARIGYVAQVRRHGRQCPGDCCMPVHAQIWFGVLGLVVWIFYGLITRTTRGGMRFVTRPTWTQKRQAKQEKKEQWLLSVRKIVIGEWGQPCEHGFHQPMTDCVMCATQACDHGEGGCLPLCLGPSSALLLPDPRIGKPIPPEPYL